MNFELFLFIITLLYLLQAAFFLWGIHRGCDQKVPSSLFVSVIVAARNEESNLPRCLEALAVQTYSRSLHEIIIVNDQSIDATEKIIADFAAATFTLPSRQCKIRCACSWKRQCTCTRHRCCKRRNYSHHRRRLCCAANVGGSNSTAICKRCRFSRRFYIATSQHTV